MTQNKCRLCPRDCRADRSRSYGVCRAGDRLKISRAALHYWEEPCISGENGSGAVFFSGCALHCVFCQNHKISDGSRGEEVSEKRLSEIFFELEEKGAENINLVTADHFIPSVARAVKDSKDRGFAKPFIFNCSGYETVESLKMLDGLIDVYLPDFKYMEPELAEMYSHALDYPGIAKQAVCEMVRQQPSCVFDAEGMIQKGVIVRNMLLPKHVANSKKVLKYLHDEYGDDIYISILSQYTPAEGIGDIYPELSRRVRKSEYDRLVDYAIKLGIKNAYIQDMTSAKESYVPDFDEDTISKPVLSSPTDSV